MKPIQAVTCVDAWTQACEHLLTKSSDSWRDLTVVLEISDPLTMPERDYAVVRRLDEFLVKSGGLPFNTVVNTIFPAQLYMKHGPAGVYDRYMNEVYPQIKKHPDCSWGTYAQRIICRTTESGKTIEPLRDLINKLRAQLSMAGPNRSVYEMGIVDPFLDLPIYEPESDRTRPIAGPCLTHLSFHLGPDRHLHLTGFYRSHYYIQRALGNLFGLAHLQHFVAQEAGIKMGSLTCISSVAQLELNSGKWGKAAVNALVKECRSLLGAMAA